MVKEIRAWRAKDGTLYDEFGKAARHDLAEGLRTLIQDHIPFSAGNADVPLSAVLDTVVNLLIDNTAKIYPAMTEYLKATAPQAGPDLSLYKYQGDSAGQTSADHSFGIPPIPRNETGA